MTTLLLLPTHNEEQTIGSVISQVQFHCPWADIVVIDSKCTDNSIAIASSMGVSVVVAEKLGYWEALKTGYRYALLNNYEKVLQVDADGQHPCSEIPRLLTALDEKDWVIASRINTGSPMSFSERVAHAGFASVVRWNTGLQITDVSSGMWALSSRCLQILLTYPFDTADVALRIFGRQNGIDIYEIPVAMSRRKAGQSMHRGLSRFFNLGSTIGDVYRLLSGRYSQASGETTADDKSASLSMKKPFSMRSTSPSVY